MILNKNAERVAGVLFLIVFIIGILIYQFLRGPVLFSDDYLINASSHSYQINTSILLGYISASISIIISIILLPRFKEHSIRLAYLYITFCIIHFVAITIENYCAVSLLNLSQEYVQNNMGGDSFFKNLGLIYYKNHLAAHYISLFISCFPVFVLYYLLIYSNLIPKAISIFGLAAVSLMCIEILFSIFGGSISMNLLIPIALIQLFLPFWLMIKGFRK